MADLGIHFTVDADASQAKRELDDLNKTVAGLNERMKEAAAAKDWKGAAVIAAQINDATSARSQTMEQSRQLQGGMPDHQEQTLSLDTSPAIQSIEELDGTLAKYQDNLRTAQENKDWKSVGQLEKIIEEATSARSKAMELSRQVQGGLPDEAQSQTVEIDTSQAIANINELDSAIANFQENLKTAQENKDWESADFIKAAIENATSARSQTMEQSRIRENPRPDDFIQKAEKNGDWKSAATNIANSERKPRYETVPANPQTGQYLQSGGPTGGGDINRRIVIDAAQAKGQIDDLNKRVVTLNEELKKAEQARDWKTFNMLTHALENTTSTRSTVMAQHNQAVSQQARENMRKGGMFGGAFGGQEGWILQQALNQITRGIIQSMDAALSAAKQRASGDYAGAAVTQKRAGGEIAGQATGATVGAGLGIGLTAVTGQAWLIPLLAGLGSEVGKFVGGIGAKKMEEDLAYSNQYKSAFQYLDALNQNFGGAINRSTGEENNQRGLQMYGRAAAATEGTGLSTQQFVEAMKQTGGYGVRDETHALNMAKTQALWSRFTGADLSAVQSFGGKAYRFSGETDAMSTAYAGLLSQNMSKGQTAEFLKAMERIMEESIAKGFVRSSEEIAGSMAMMYKLSGGSSLWQGEQGAQRLSQMNAVSANATNLQNVEDVISFGAARELLMADGTEKSEANFWRLTGNTGVAITANANLRSSAEGGDNIMGTLREGQRVDVLGREGDYYRVNNNGREGYVHNSLLATSGNVHTGTYADIMQLLERGISPDLLKGQFEAVSRLEGDNRAGIVERFRTMYGLNYTGATQVWDMMMGAKDKDGNFNFDAADYARQIEEMKVDPRLASDSELLQTAINKMTNNLVNIGKFKFDETERELLESQAADVASILAKLREGNTGLPPPLLPSQEFDPTIHREADRRGMAMDYYTTSATSRVGDPDFADFQNAYVRMMDPYKDNTSLFNNLLGSGNLQSFQEYIDGAQHRPIDRDDRDFLANALRGAIEDFREIIRGFNNTHGTEIQFPDTINVIQW